MKKLSYLYGCRWMPQAVDAYVSGKVMNKLILLNGISLSLYEEDLAKNTIQKTGKSVSYLSNNTRAARE